MATSLEEGKLISDLLYSAQKWTLGHILLMQNGWVSLYIRYKIKNVIKNIIN